MKKTHQIVILVMLTIFTVSQFAEAQAIKGWGTGAKGAAISAGTTLGAIINKQNQAVGGLPAGVIGGGAGYAVGKNARRRWSPQATGTTIGAGAGAAVGAIINKRNRVVGGVIGGVVGGAAGYAIGKRKDNKNKAEAARVAAAEQAAADKAAAERAAADKAATEKAAADRIAADKAAAEKAAADRAAADHAEQAKAVAQKTAAPMKEETTRPAVATVAPQIQGVSLVNANKPTVPYVLKSGFLPNDTYGDPLSPYPTSEYRRKSW